ncbi:MAG: FAD-binding protein [Chitinophagaceae bacterium]
MASVSITHVTDWNNYHFNGPFPAKLLFDIDTDRSIGSLIERFNDSARAIQALLKDSISNNERFRAYGKGWSLSNIAHQPDRMLFNTSLDIKRDISDKHLHALTTYKSENLFLFQCGINVKKISEYLLNKGKSLKTCGASNGQTLAGAISTGVHGSAIDTGSIQDGVVGIQLITGPGANDIIYVERETRPALNDNFAKSINARVVRNDSLFNAALVSLGSFGVIHGIVMEAEDIFLLKRYVKKIKKADALEIAKNMNFTNAAFKIQEEVQDDGTVTRPYHYKLYINPYNANEDFVTEIIYKKPYRAKYPNPVPFIQKSIFRDIPSWVADFAAKHKRIIPLILQALKSEAFPEVDNTIEGTLGEIFWDTSQSSAAFGCGFGINTADTEKALDLFIGLMQDKGPVPGILSMRFVKGTDATLGFTKFPITCILEVDGIPWKENDNMISLDNFLTAVIEAFTSNNIHFTLHWGKNAPWAFPGLVDTMYGAAAEEWKNLRSTLLTEKTADLFSNDFLNAVKLDNYKVDVPADLIALRNLITVNNV